MRTQAEQSLRAALAITFGQEWVMLSPADRTLIVRDCTEEGGVQDLGEYQQNIGLGNLHAYVACQRVRFAKSNK